MAITYCRKFAKSIRICKQNCHHNHPVFIKRSYENLCEKYTQGFCDKGKTCKRIHSAIHALYYAEQCRMEIPKHISNEIMEAASHMYKDPIIRWMIFREVNSSLQFINHSLVNIIKSYLSDNNNIGTLADPEMFYKYLGCRCHLCGKKYKKISWAGFKECDGKIMAFMMCNTCYTLILSENLLVFGLQDYTIYETGPKAYRTNLLHSHGLSNYWISFTSEAIISFD